MDRSSIPNAYPEGFKEVRKSADKNIPQQLSNINNCKLSNMFQKLNLFPNNFGSELYFSFKYII